MKVDGIIFDLDGTLWDSTKEVSKTWTSIVSKYNLKRKEVSIEDLKPCMGKLLDEIAEILFPGIESKVQMKIINECCEFESHKLDKYFSDYECPGRTGLTKGENIKLVIKRNNLKNPIYVGDTQGDANAAKFAGVPFIFAEYGFGEVEQYNESIKSFNELLKLI